MTSKTVDGGYAGRSHNKVNHMKKFSIFLLALVSTVVLSCSGKDVKYVVKGVNAPASGMIVYLIDGMSSEIINSTVISDGAFEMKGTAEKDALLAVKIGNAANVIWMFNDGKPVKINVADETLSGSALNNKLDDCMKKRNAEYKELFDMSNEFGALSTFEQRARMQEFIPKYNAAVAKYTDFCMGLIEENKDNIIPVAIIPYIAEYLDAQKLDGLFSSDAPFAKHPFIIDYKDYLEHSGVRTDNIELRKQSIVGKKFIDLEEPDADGVMHKLSEYVGKGNWVLIDFWASWCGPCKSEMPNVVEAYKKYHDKCGFNVVGLSFDRDKDAWTKAIVSWDMPWIHLSDLNYWQTVAAGIYNVDSIPDNLLVDPQGNVVARGLRGQELAAKLAEIFE